jgi:hypothetical protein
MSLEENLLFNSAGIPPKSRVSCIEILCLNGNAYSLSRSLVTEPQTITSVNQKEKDQIMKVVGSTAPMVKPEVNEAKHVARPGGRGVSSNVFAQGSRMNTGNYITDRPTSRVTQPPGGRSSISFY